MANGVTKANTQSVNQRKRDEEEEARRQSQARKRQEEEMKRQQAEMKRQQEEAARQQEAERKRQAETSRKNETRNRQGVATPDASIPVLEPKYASAEAIQRGREVGRRARAAVDAGEIQSDDFFTRGLPGMAEVYHEMAKQKEAQAQAEAEARQQWESYRDRMLAENASRNAQRHGQLSAQSTTMPMDQNMAGQMPTQDVQTIANGPVDVLGTRRDRGDSRLTAAAQREIDGIDNEINSLRRSFTGDAGIDEVTNARISELERKKEAINNAGRSKNDYLVTREEYDKLNSDSEFANDISNLAEIIYNPRRAGGNATANAISQRLTEMDAQDYIANLSDKYGLSEEELRDIAKTRHADDKAGYNEEIQKRTSEFSEKNPVLGSLASLYGSVGNSMEGLYNVPAGLLTNDDRNLVRGFNSAKAGLREGAKENLSNEARIARLEAENVNGINDRKIAALKNKDGSAAQSFYDIGMGLGDLAVGALTGNAPLLLAGNTANEAMLNTVDKGQSTRKAALYGGASGVADYFFNKIGLDKAKDLALQSVKSEGVMKLLANMGIAGAGEAGENLLQDITQSILDEFINKDQSDLRLAFADKVNNGMGETEAFKEVVKDYAAQEALSMATGFAMGAGMMGGTTVANEIKGGILNDVLDKNSRIVNDRLEKWRAEKARQNAENQIDPLELAKQNEADIPTMEAQAEQAQAEIQRLAEEVPEVPEERLTPEEVEALKRGNEAMEAPKESPAEAFDRERKEAIATLSEADKRNVRATIRNSDIGTRSYPDVDLKDKAAARQYWNEATEEARRAYELFDPDSPEAYYAAEVISARMADLEKSYKQALNAADNSELPWFNPNPKGDLAAIESRINDRFSRFDVSGNEELSQLKNDITDAVNDLYDAIDGTDIGAVNDANKRLASLIGKFDRRAKKEFENYKSIGGRDVSRPAWRYEQLNTSEPELTDEEFSDLFGGKSAKPTEPEVPAVEEIADQTAKQADEIPAVAAADGNIPPKNGEVTNEDVNPPENIPPEEGNGNPPSKDIGRRRTYTNTGVKSGVVDPHDLENDPVLKQDVQYEVRHEADTMAEASQTLSKNRDMYAEQYASGTMKVNRDVDLDRAMMLAKDDRTSKWMKDSILRNAATHGTDAGQFINAFKKWANTAVGAEAKATQVLVDRTEKWASRNKKLKETNNRVAQAINLIGVPESKGKRVPVSHDELKAQITKTIQDAFGKDASKFNDNDIEYLTVLAETKKVPVRTITRELEHKLETGEWFTIDESLPKKVEKAIKNGTISNMLDRIVNGEPAKVEKEPEAYGRFLAKIRNSLQDENIGLSDEFDDTDVYFLGKLIQERVPKKEIENELRHRIETGEWYTIDESIQAPKTTDQKLQNAFKILRGEDTKTEAAPKTFDQIRKEVKNTLEKNKVLDKYSDEDIDYLTNLRQQGATTKYLADALDTKEATGSWGIKPETQERVNEIFEMMRHYDEDSREFCEGQAEAFRLLANEVAPNASALEKYDTWRYMAMLGNPKTMFRNWIGNKLFSTVTGVANNFAALGEMGADAAVKGIGSAEAKKVQRLYDEITRLEDTGGSQAEIQRLTDKADKLSERAERHANGIERTKAIINPFKDIGLIDAGKRDAEFKRWRQVDGAKYEKIDQESLTHNRSAFNSKVMQLAEKAVDAGISDTKAVINKYATSLAGYMKANGLDQSAFDDSYKFDELNRKSKYEVLTDEESADMEALRDTAARMEKARDYALKQAEYATFHEDNEVASFLSHLSNKARTSKSGIVRGLGYAFEGTLPFKKTPANILRSAAEFSPLGAIDSIRQTGKLIYENTGSRKGNLEDEYTKVNRLTHAEKTVQKSLASDVIESWSKTLTGSALAYLGYYLFNKGVLTSSDDGEKYQDQLEGKGNYAININGHTYTLDWAAPGVMPLLLGAEINKVFKSNGRLDEEWYSNPDKWMNTINSLLDPMLETSMLSGLKDTLTNAANEVRYNENGALGGIIGSMLENMALGYATQAIPTLSGQIARTIDPIRRTTDTKYDGILGNIEKQARKAANKIPFLSMLNPEYRDARGERQYNSPYQYEKGNIPQNIRAFENNLVYQMLSPGYYSEVNTTDADRLGRDLYNMLDENGHYIEGVSNDSGVFADWRSTKKIDGQKLDPQQMQTFRENMGHANEGLREELYNSDWYYELDPKAQRDLVNSLNTIADKVGQYSVMPGSVNQEDADLSAYIAAGGGKEGIQAIVDNLEAEHNIYGLSKGTYNELKDSGADLSQYEGYGEALKKYGLSDNATNREAWLGENPEKTLADNAEYTKVMTENGLGDYTSKSAHMAYDKQEFDLYKEYRKYIADNEIRDSEKAWSDYRTGALQRNTEKAAQQEDLITTLDGYGLNKDGPKYTYEKASTVFPDWSVQDFAQKYKAIDADHNQGIKQTEIIDFLNSGSYSQSEGEEYWEAFGKTEGSNAWKKIPVRDDNGTWSLKSK